MLQSFFSLRDNLWCAEVAVMFCHKRFWYVHKSCASCWHWSLINIHDALLWWKINDTSMHDGLARSERVEVQLDVWHTCANFSPEEKSQQKKLYEIWDLHQKSESIYVYLRGVKFISSGDWQHGFLKIPYSSNTFDFLCLTHLYFS